MGVQVPQQQSGVQLVAGSGLASSLECLEAQAESPATPCYPEKVCMKCGTTKTPMWRNSPYGPKTMCNACGVKLQRAQNKAKAKALAAGLATPVFPAPIGVAKPRRMSSLPTSDQGAGSSSESQLSSSNERRSSLPTRPPASSTTHGRVRVTRQRAAAAAATAATAAQLGAECQADDFTASVDMLLDGEQLEMDMPAGAEAAILEGTDEVELGSLGQKCSSLDSNKGLSWHRRSKRSPVPGRRSADYGSSLSRSQTLRGSKELRALRAELRVTKPQARSRATANQLAAGRHLVAQALPDACSLSAERQSAPLHMYGSHSLPMSQALYGTSSTALPQQMYAASGQLAASWDAPLSGPLAGMPVGTAGMQSRVGIQSSEAARMLSKSFPAAQSQELAHVQCKAATAAHQEQLSSRVDKCTLLLPSNSSTSNPRLVSSSTSMRQSPHSQRVEACHVVLEAQDGTPAKAGHSPFMLKVYSDEGICRACTTVPDGNTKYDQRTEKLAWLSSNGWGLEFSKYEDFSCLKGMLGAWDQEMSRPEQYGQAVQAAGASMAAGMLLREGSNHSSLPQPLTPFNEPLMPAHSPSTPISGDMQQSMSMPLYAQQQARMMLQHQQVQQQQQAGWADMFGASIAMDECAMPQMSASAPVGGQLMRTSAHMHPITMGLAAQPSWAGYTGYIGGQDFSGALPAGHDSALDGGSRSKSPSSNAGMMSFSGMDVTGSSDNSEVAEALGPSSTMHHPTPGAQTTNVMHYGHGMAASPIAQREASPTPDYDNLLNPSDPVMGHEPDMDLIAATCAFGTGSISSEAVLLHQQHSPATVTSPAAVTSPPITASGAMHGSGAMHASAAFNIPAAASTAFAGQHSQRLGSSSFKEVMPVPEVYIGKPHVHIQHNMQHNLSGTSTATECELLDLDLLKQQACRPW